MADPFLESMAVKLKMTDVQFAGALQYALDRLMLHIARVGAYAFQLKPYIEMMYHKDIYDQLEKSAVSHDDSKLSDDELIGMVCTTEYYRRKKYGLDFSILDVTKPEQDAFWEHHKNNNNHHPEYFKDIHQMGIVELLHMCCDWAAMSEEMGNSIISWAHKVIPSKYNFDKRQKDIVFSCCNFLESKINAELEFVKDSSNDMNDCSNGCNVDINLNYIVIPSKVQSDCFVRCPVCFKSSSHIKCDVTTKSHADILSIMKAVVKDWNDKNLKPKIN